MIESYRGYAWTDLRELIDSRWVKWHVLVLRSLTDESGANPEQKTRTEALADETKACTRISQGCHLTYILIESLKGESRQLCILKSWLLTGYGQIGNDVRQKSSATLYLTYVWSQPVKNQLIELATLLS